MFGMPSRFSPIFCLNLSVHSLSSLHPTRCEYVQGLHNWSLSLGNERCLRKISCFCFDDLTVDCSLRATTNNNAHRGGEDAETTDRHPKRKKNQQRIMTKKNVAAFENQTGKLTGEQWSAHISVVRGSAFTGAVHSTKQYKIPK